MSSLYVVEVTPKFSDQAFQSHLHRGIQGFPSIKSHFSSPLPENNWPSGFIDLIQTAKVIFTPGKAIKHMLDNLQ